MSEHAPHSRRGGADSYDLFAESATLTPAKRDSDSWKLMLGVALLTLTGTIIGFALSGVAGGLLGGGLALAATGVLTPRSTLVMGWLRAVNERIP